jgi:broad specificity phosphatase PhoE
MTSQLLLVRHGQTPWSVLGRHTGRTDIELTDAGREEARATARTLSDWTIDRVFSSPLSRARDTAGLVGLTPEIEIDSDLVEWNYGDYEGKRTADVRLDIPEWSVWTHPMAGGESLDEVSARVDAFLERVEQLRPLGNVAVFAHGHVLSIMIARWCGLAPIEGRRFALATATVSLLGAHRDDRVVRALNHRCGDALQPPERAT